VKKTNIFCQTKHEKNYLDYIDLLLINCGCHSGSLLLSDEALNPTSFLLDQKRSKKIKTARILPHQLLDIARRQGSRSCA
jgi:hypothetical protein